jgi:hypothetical protein
VSLAARHLEENGIATVVMGCAKDIVEFVGVPRFLFRDFPLGNATGRPKDSQSQAFTLELALSVLESAPTARTTVQSRRCAGEKTLRGSSTIPTSSACRPKRFASGARNSISRRKSPRISVTGLLERSHHIKQNGEKTSFARAASSICRPKIIFA